VQYDPSHAILIIGGQADPTEEEGTAASHGVTVWRILSGSPHYKMVTDYEQDLNAVKEKICGHVFPILILMFFRVGVNGV
jgi:hypothetical protein